MALLRRVLGETLRGRRVRERRTLREVSGAARVSLGYLSEVERGQKEASSELLAAICEALGIRVSELLHEVSESMRNTEVPVRRIPAVPRREPAGVGPRPTAPTPRLPVPGRDDLPVGREIVLEPAGADGPTESTQVAETHRAPQAPQTPQAPERPLEPVGTEQAVFDQRADHPAPEVDRDGSCPGVDTVVFDGEIVSLVTCRSVVAAA